jgi:hypothetical protein
MIAAARRLGAASLCTAALVVAVASPPAQAAGAPTVFYASQAMEGSAGAPYPPGSGLEGPCGLAVDAKGAFYVSDYYHDVVDAFSAGRKYLTQVSGIDPADGPCGLAVDAAGNLYVNDYHRSVLRFAPAVFPLVSGTAYGPGSVIDPNRATGVAVDTATGTVYVNERTRIAAYDSSGAEVELGGSRLEIGKGTLDDGYGLAFSQFPGTLGRLYVADAATDTVKVYDPAVDAIAPVATIDGAETPTGGFVSLRDAALAVDRVTGELYVLDNLQPVGFERPEAAVYVFKADGSYEGRLSTNVVDALPSGLAVDNSSGGTQGRVYVTSGNTAGASVNIYIPGAASKAAPICAPGGACPTPAEAAGLMVSALAPSTDGSPVADPATSAAKRAGSGGGSIVQKGTLRVSIDGSLSPQRLPRRGAAPIGVSVSGRVSTTDGSHPPQLEAIRIELNRHGHLDFAGLPTCPYNRIQPASSDRALAACRAALVGRGRFEAEISLGTQEPYFTSGQMLVFNGKRHGKPVLFGQIYAPRPFATSFVIVFALRRISHGTYGSALTASLPKALGSWGNLTAIEMRLSRRFTYKGERRSFLSAGCPAPAGFPGTIFSLARASFRFAGAGELTSTLTRSCQVR